MQSYNSDGPVSLSGGYYNVLDTRKALAKDRGKTMLRGDTVVTGLPSICLRVATHVQCSFGRQRVGRGCGDEKI